jgi:FlaA1/EpsC-like NDP-sugar epimerase
MPNLFLLPSLMKLKSKNIQALLILDFILLPLALVTSILLRLGGEWDYKLNHDLWLFIALPLWTIPIFINLGLYKAIIQYLDEKIIAIVLYGVTISVLILVGVTHFFQIDALPKTSIIIFWVFALAYIGGTRVFFRGIIRRSNHKNKKNIIIYGAGTAGIQLSVALFNGSEYEPIAFLDDNPKKWGTVIKGIPVYKPRRLHSLIEDNEVEQILIAIPSATKSRRNKIIKYLEQFSIVIKTLPGVSSLINGDVTVNDIIEVDIEDLLGREEIPSDKTLIEKNIKGKVVLVTGAGGSIGSELTRQIALLNPQLLVVLDMSEFALYSISQEISKIFPYIKKIDVLGSVTSNHLINSIIETYNINTIYHAAAYKHVPIVEHSPIIGIKNNVMGTYVIAKAAIKHKVDTVVLISTDKAVRPSNIMGASKRLAEMILQAFHSKSDHTIFTMVRFGNVLGSSGSVVPLFREQIKNGGPITVTHPDIIRYFMTIPEAVGLVIQASNMATGGEVFVLDMGAPIKIVDLARQMIHLSGLKVKDEVQTNGDVEIVFSGLRPGEKLFEELLIGNNPTSTNHPRIMCAKESYLEYNELLVLITKLEQALYEFSLNDVLVLLKNLVPEYNPSINLHESI